MLLVELRLWPGNEVSKRIALSSGVFVNPDTVVMISHHTASGKTCRVFTSASGDAGELVVMGSKDEVAAKLSTHIRDERGEQ